MKQNAWIALAATAGVVVASQGQYAAQLGVMALTLAVFFGTLTLRRPTADATTTHPGH
ncbi:MAG: hypothetical protein FJ104_16155 [Deltaproteobacteria bacterium]|nr:hypothetical protein [Deltaproteobacteria bacterium]